MGTLPKHRLNVTCINVCGVSYGRVTAVVYGIFHYLKLSLCRTFSPKLQTAMKLLLHCFNKRILLTQEAKHAENSQKLHNGSGTEEHLHDDTTVMPHWTVFTCFFFLIIFNHYLLFVHFQTCPSVCFSSRLWFI